MKKLIFTLFSASLFLTASAQLQLTYNNAPGILPGSTVVGKNDMIHKVKVLGTGLPDFTPATNMHWDMSAVQYNTGYDYIGYDTSTSVVFIPAEYSGSMVYFLTSSIPYSTHPKFEIRTIGMYTYGEHMDRQAFPLGIFTTDMNDSLVILNQDILYTSPLKNMPYPTAPNISYWSSNYTYTTNMSLTYTSQSFNQAPVTRVSYTTRVDSAVGWGTVSALRLDNTQGGEVDVVQVKTMISVEDSFYVNGNLMPQNVLSTFNFSQGQVNHIYQYSFYRAGEITPIVAVFYNDDQFSDIKSISLHRERLPVGTAVANVTSESGMVIYPNPATSLINIGIKDASIASCNYELLNVTGQSVASGVLALSGGVAQITTGDLSAGLYYIRLAHDNVIIGQAAVAITK